MDETKTKLEWSKLPADLQGKLVAWEKNNPANQQVESLKQVVEQMSKVTELLGQGAKQDDASSQDIKTLIEGTNQALATLTSREAPQTPDYATPIVDALEGLKTSLAASLEAVSKEPVLKPTINVASPSVRVDVPRIDLSGVEKALKVDMPAAFKAAIALVPKTPATNLTPLADLLTQMSEQLTSIEHATRMKPLPGSMKVTNPDGSNIAGGSGLTDAQLRATPVPVSGTVAVTGGATAAKQDSQTALLTTIDGDTSNLDVTLSTRTKPSDQQHTIVDSQVPSGDNANTGTITALNGTVQLAVSGYKSHALVISGTWAATLIFETSSDNAVTWNTSSIHKGSGTQLSLGLIQTVILSSITANGTYKTNSTGGITHIRVKASAYTSGTVNVTITETDAAHMTQFGQVSVTQAKAVSTNNSSTVNINAGADFTGTSDSSLGAGFVNVSIFADRACTIQVQQAKQDPGTNWDTTDSWTYDASSGGSGSARTVALVASSYRVIVTNTGGSPTTTFRLQSILSPFGEAAPRSLSELGNNQISLEEIDGTSISTGNGIASGGTQRVVIASDNSPVPTSLSSVPLPTGAATAAKQDTGNTSLSSIDSKLSGTLATSLASVPQATLPAAPKNNQVTITTAGTRVQLGSNTLTVGVIIQALSTNTGLVYVGDSGVSSSNGFELQAGQATSVGVTNTNAIWVDASVNGSKICFIGS